MEYKIGETVRAFHPKMMGVVKQGTVEGVVHRTSELLGTVAVALMVDFGQLLGGIYTVPLEHIIVEETDGA